MQLVLILNSGSSSIKYQLFDMSDRTVLASGVVERIGESLSSLTHKTYVLDGVQVELVEAPILDHRQGITMISRALLEHNGFGTGDSLPIGIGHRVVHGGEQFVGPVRVDDRVIESIRELIPFAPLHNPANLLGIEVSRVMFPNVPQVAVFDTAFHQTLPPHAYHYAIPRDYYEQFRVRRYGFHGTSHYYVAKQVAKQLDVSIDDLNAIIFHLGNGASATAIRNGRSEETSMGLTPLEGLVMGTRSGDLDPAVVFHLGKLAGRTMEELDGLLNKESGLKGICGANDMREVLQLANRGDPSAQLAVELFVHRARKYLGAYYAILGRVDAVAFTAGIGENSPEIRARICEHLEALGIGVDASRNLNCPREICEIQSPGGQVKVLVVPTDEELEIAEQTLACIDEADR